MAPSGVPEADGRGGRPPARLEAGHEPPPAAPLDAPGREPVEELAGIERAVAGELDRPRLVHLVLSHAARLFEGTGTVLVADGDRLVTAARTYEEIVAPSVAIGEGAAGRCAQTRRGLLVNDYAAWPHALGAAVASGTRHLMAQPVALGDELLGVITVARAGPEAPPFTADDLAVLGVLAARIALALRNATLYETAARRRAEAEALARIARALTEVQDVGEVAGRIVESVLALHRGAVGVGVAAARADGRLELLASVGPVSRLLRPGQPVSPGSLMDRVARERRPISIADLPAEPVPEAAAAARRREFAAAGVRGALGLPLFVQGRTVGVLGITFGERRSFTAEELALAQAFADQAAIALENARLYEDAERRRREAEAVAEIARTINASLDLDAILQQVAEAARTLCGSDIARIALHDPASDAMVFRYWVNTRYEGYEAARLRPGTDSLGGLALLTHRPVRTERWMADQRFSKETGFVVRAEGIVAQMAVPIRIGGAAEGLLYVDNRSARPFTDADEAALVRLAEHAAVAIRNARLFTAVQATGARLQALSARLLDVQEVERRHLARELHDEVGQALTAVRINLHMLGREAAPGPAAGRIEDCLGMVDRILQSVRRLSLDLRPSLLDDLGLAAALRWYVTAQAERAGLGATVAVGPLALEPPPSLATTCFRVAQEAVTNVVRHAHATRLEVLLQDRPGEMELIVRDDGVGFDVAGARARAARGGSLGLLGLEERVELAGGQVRIESSAGGTEVRARFPVPAAAPGEAADPS